MTEPLHDQIARELSKEFFRREFTAIMHGVPTDTRRRGGLMTSLLRDMAHSKLDEALDMYERGEPLWINTGLVYKSTNGEDVRLDIYIKDNA